MEMTACLPAFHETTAFQYGDEAVAGEATAGDPSRRDRPRHFHPDRNGIRRRVRRHVEAPWWSAPGLLSGAQWHGGGVYHSSTVTLLFDASTSLFTAGIITVPMLGVAPAALAASSGIAVTVVEPPFSEIDDSIISAPVPTSDSRWLGIPGSTDPALDMNVEAVRHGARYGREGETGSAVKARSSTDAETGTSGVGLPMIIRY